MRRALVVALLVILVAPMGAGVTADNPATLTLEAPAYAAAGAAMRAFGNLTLVGAPLVAQAIEVYRNGTLVTTDVTTTRGSYAVSIPLPAARTSVSLQTVWRSSLGEERSPIVQVTTVEPPSAPLALAAATTAGRAPVQLSWTPPADDGGGPITSYRVERRVDAGAWTFAGTSGALSFADATAPAGSVVSYRVSAINAAGQGARSSESAVIVAPAAPRSLAGASDASGTVTLTWAAPAGGAAPITSYRVTRDGATVGMTLTTSFSESGLPAFARVEYRVAASNDGGEGAPTAPLVVRTPPAAVAGFAGSAAPGTDTVVLTWPAADPTMPSPITHYRIHRLDGATWTFVTQPTGSATSAQDRDRPWGTVQRYRLTPYNAAGAGPSVETDVAIGPEATDLGLEIDVAYVCPAPVGRSPDANGCAVTGTGFEWPTSPGAISYQPRISGDMFYVESGPARNEPYDAWTTTLVRRWCGGAPGCTEDIILRSDVNATRTTSSTGQIIFWAQTDAWTLPAGHCHDVFARVIGTHPHAIEDEEYVALTRFCA